MELCAEQGAFVTQETRSHSREENGNYFGALPSPPQALPMLTPGGINAGRLSACLHPCPCHRTLALTNSLTAVPVCCSRHTYQSRQSRGAFSLKSDRAMKQTKGSRGNIPIYMSVPNIKVCALLPKIHSACYLDLKFTWPRPSAAHTLLSHLPPRSALPSNSARN